MLIRLSFKAMTFVTGILPRRVQYALSRPLADIYYLCGRQARESVQGNLRRVLGPDASEALVRRETRAVFRAFGMYLCEFFGARHFGPKFIDEHVVVQGREHLDAALAKGRGAIFCSAHYSNWEFGGMIVAHLGYPITGVYQTHADSKTNAMFVEQRAKWGVTVVPSSHGAKGALRALRQNETVALMGDRATGGPVVPVEFAGQTAYFPQGPWRIALTTGAALLPTFIHRRFDGQFTLEIGAPLAIEPGGTQQERMSRLGRAWAQCLETQLKTDPAQWTVFYDFWKKPAAGGSAMADTAASDNLIAKAKAGAAAEDSRDPGRTS